VLRLGRGIYPVWRGDSVTRDWRYAELFEILTASGFRIEQSGRYNILFWLWEILPLTFWPFEILTPFFVYLDLLLSLCLERYSAHCYFVLRHDTSPLEES
jgi:hypothetical protein